MKQILVVGVGAGDPEQLTVQAVNALARVDVFFVLDKGDVKQELVDLREEILHRYAPDGDYRVAVGRDPSGTGRPAWRAIGRSPGVRRTSSRWTTGGGAGPMSVRG